MDGAHAAFDPRRGGRRGVRGIPRRSCCRCPSHNPEPCRGWVQPGKEQAPEGLNLRVYRAFSVGAKSSIAPPQPLPRPGRPHGDRALVFLGSRAGGAAILIRRIWHPGMGNGSPPLGRLRIKCGPRLRAPSSRGGGVGAARVQRSLPPCSSRSASGACRPSGTGRSAVPALDGVKSAETGGSCLAAALGGDVGGVPPGGRPALVHVGVAQEPIEYGRDGGDVPAQLSQFSTGRFEVMRVEARSWPARGGASQLGATCLLSSLALALAWWRSLPLPARQIRAGHRSGPCPALHPRSRSSPTRAAWR